MYNITQHGIADTRHTDIKPTSCTFKFRGNIKSVQGRTNEFQRLVESISISGAGIQDMNSCDEKTDPCYW